LTATRKDKLTAAERAVFAEAVKNVKPLSAINKNKKIFPPEKIIKKFPKKIVSDWNPQQEKFTYPSIDLDYLAPEDWVGIEDSVTFHRSGLQNKLLKKLAQGHLAIEKTLDLHRLTLSTALAQAESFLQNCQQQGCRLALIIHGKGKKSDKPILKNALNLWLRTQDNVLAFHSARPKDGGAGAVYVLIKKPV
jgi:DNA-nicking Smr family endonuclease